MLSCREKRQVLILGVRIIAIDEFPPERHIEDPSNLNVNLVDTSSLKGLNPHA